LSTPELRELVKISKILALTNASALERELAKVATTPERKKIWVAIDGTRTQQQIADAAGVAQSAVSKFLEAAQAADLVEYEKPRPPRRKLDYVPPLWVELMVPAAENLTAKPGEPATKTLDNLSQEERGP